MNWKVKAGLHKTLEVLPGSSKINYVFQRYIARNLPVNKELFIAKVFDAHLHFDHLLKYGPQKPIGEIGAFEFGAGWDLVGPLSYFFLGIKNQKLIDLKPHVKFELINNSLNRFSEYACDFAPFAHFISERLEIQNPKIDSLTLLKQSLGIDYRAPMNAGQTSFPDESVDFITSTNTFEHIPEAQIPCILSECKRILRPGGVMCFRIDYQDHYAYFDLGISLYNYLQFSEKEWKKYNHSIQFQNRLRHGEYLVIFENAGLNIVKEVTYKIKDQDRQTLDLLELATMFKNHSEKDLLTRWCYFVLKK